MKPFLDQIHWPAVIHYDNDAELEYVESAETWQSGQHHAGQYEANDLLIDSEGQMFSFSQDRNGSFYPEKINKNMQLQEMLGLHLFCELQAFALHRLSCVVQLLQYCVPHHKLVSYLNQTLFVRILSQRIF